MYVPKRPFKIQDTHWCTALSKIFKHWSYKLLDVGYFLWSREYLWGPLKVSDQGPKGPLKFMLIWNTVSNFSSFKCRWGGGHSDILMWTLLVSKNIPPEQVSSWLFQVNTPAEFTLFSDPLMMFSLKIDVFKPLNAKCMLCLLLPKKHPISVVFLFPHVYTSISVPGWDNFSLLDCPVGQAWP